MVEKYYEEGRRRLIPIIPKDSSFKNHYLRSSDGGASSNPKDLQ